MEQQTRPEVGWHNAHKLIGAAVLCFVCTVTASFLDNSHRAAAERHDTARIAFDAAHALYPDAIESSAQKSPTALSAAQRLVIERVAAPACHDIAPGSITAFQTAFRAAIAQDRDKGILNAGLPLLLAILAGRAADHGQALDPVVVQQVLLHTTHTEQGPFDAIADL